MYIREQNVIEKQYFTLKLLFYFARKRNTNVQVSYTVAAVMFLLNSQHCQIKAAAVSTQGTAFTPSRVLIMTLVASEKKSRVCNFMRVFVQEGIKSVFINNEGIANVMKICHV